MVKITKTACVNSNFLGNYNCKAIKDFCIINEFFKINTIISTLAEHMTSGEKIMRYSYRNCIKIFFKTD